MATANKKLATAVSATIAGPVLSLTFSNGQTLTVDANALSPDIQHAAMMHGLKQKLIDAAAIARDPETGRTATIDDKYDAVCDVYSRITAPEGSTWNKTRIAGEAAGVKGGLLARAMMRLTSKSRAEIMTYLDGLNKEQVAALRKNPRVMEVIAQLQVEQANTSGVDSDALLDSLMEGADADGDDESGSEEEGESIPVSNDEVQEAEENALVDAPLPEDPATLIAPPPKAKGKGKAKTAPAA